jgi:XTP/dITP diphosphohydrolase
MGMMRNKKDRTAIFRTVVALITPSGEEHVFEGSVPGTLLMEPRVAAQPKMPYSPLFVPHGQTKSAEMSTEEENASHEAFRKVASSLNE